MMEIWKPIIDYENIYEISNYGKIKRIKDKYGNPCSKILNPYKNKDGYFRVGLHKDEKRNQFFVHRLILETFIGPCPKGMECCHNNGDPSNNFVENLRWDTSLSNTKDSIKHGTKYIFKNTKGQKHPMSKLNNWKIRIINRLLEDKSLTHKEISKIFNVGRSCITKINNKKRWKHINV